MNSRTDISTKMKEHLSITTEEGFNAFDTALKKCIVSKIKEVTPIESISEEAIKENRAEDFLDLYLSNITEENSNQLIEPFSSYLLSEAGKIQECEIAWLSGTGMGEPLINVNTQGKWTTLMTDMESDPVEIFSFIYNTFQENYIDLEDKKITKNKRDV